MSSLYDLNMEIKEPDQLPSVLELCTLDVIIAKAHLAMNKLFGNTDEDPDQTHILSVAMDFLPAVMNLIPLYQKFAR